MAAPVKERRPEAAPAAPVRPVRLGPRDVVVERRPDGTVHLKSPHALAPYPAKLTERLDHWAATTPERIFWRNGMPAAAGASSPMPRPWSRSAASARRCCGATFRRSGRS